MNLLRRTIAARTLFLTRTRDGSRTLPDRILLAYLIIAAVLVAGIAVILFRRAQARRLRDIRHKQRL